MESILKAFEVVFWVLFWAAACLIACWGLLRYAGKRDAKREDRGEVVNRSLAPYWRKTKD